MKRVRVAENAGRIQDDANQAPDDIAILQSYLSARGLLMAMANLGW